MLRDKVLAAKLALLPQKSLKLLQKGPIQFSLSFDFRIICNRDREPYDEGQ